jgi:hypothetical protein
MPLDLALFSPEELQPYQELGRRFDPEDALAQADSDEFESKPRSAALSSGQ